MLNAELTVGIERRIAQARKSGKAGKGSERNGMWVHVMLYDLTPAVQMSRLEATRDFTQKIVHVDMDAFVSIRHCC